MKQILTIILAALAITSYAQEPTITIRYGEQIELNQDSIGLAFLSNSVGFTSKGASIGLVKGFFEGRVIAVVGNTNGDSCRGLMVSTDGEMLTINSNVVVIVRKTFASHADADAALITGEEYYLEGDRIVYRKP